MTPATLKTSDTLETPDIHETHEIETINLSDSVTDTPGT